jgi:DNA-binding NarL/FixJ family response regulator
MQCRVLLCDDSEIFRMAVRKFLSAHAFVDLVGESSHFAESIQMVADLRPDLVILDLRMVPEIAIHPRPLTNVCNAKRLLVVSASAGQEDRDLAEAMGADAFLDKMDFDAKLIPTIVWLSSNASAQPMRLIPIG